MGNKVLKYGFGAIALYLVVYNFTGAGKLLDEGGKAGAGLIKAFQGRG